MKAQLKLLDEWDVCPEFDKLETVKINGSPYIQYKDCHNNVITIRNDGLPRGVL